MTGPLTSAYRVADPPTLREKETRGLLPSETQALL